MKYNLSHHRREGSNIVLLNKADNSVLCYLIVIKLVFNLPYNYYQALYSEKLNKDDKSYKDSLNTFLTNNNIPQLNEEQKQASDKTITEQEILNSIKQLTNGKTPGADFYNFFWIDIKHLLTTCFFYML